MDADLVRDGATRRELTTHPAIGPDGALRVGDLVRVGRPCLDNPSGTRALVVEVYDRRALRIGDGLGVQLLFPNGAADGFSPRDRELWGVTFLDHRPALAGYHFTSIGRLVADWRDGLFAEAFDDTGR